MFAAATAPWRATTTMTWLSLLTVLVLVLQVHASFRVDQPDKAQQSLAAQSLTSQQVTGSSSAAYGNSNSGSSYWDLVIAKEKAEVTACHAATQGYLDRMDSLANLTSSAFFDCWRPQDQMFAFLDKLAAKYPALITRIHNASSTYENRTIPAYRIFNGTGRPAKAIYVQSLIHAREWQAGSSVVYSIAAFLDELHAQQEDAVQILKNYAFYFVPILNLDGYIFSWKVDRYWRKNRRTIDANGTLLDGIDLNRNFGPLKYFNVELNDDIDSETYPGSEPLTEPETRGIVAFVKSLPGLSASVDVHTFGALVLHPYGNMVSTPGEPFGSHMEILANKIRDAMGQGGSKYTSEPSYKLYVASGCFDDFLFMEFKSRVPSITIELEGDDFIVPQESIRRVGKDLFRGLKQYANETTRYQQAIATSVSVSSNASSSDGNFTATTADPNTAALTNLFMRWQLFALLVLGFHLQ